MTNTKEPLETLQKPLLTEGAAIPTHNLLPDYRSLFTEASLDVLDKPLARTQFKQRKVDLGNGDYRMDSDTCQYFCFRVIGKHNIPKAVDILADIINIHSSLGHIDSFLTPLSYIELGDIGFDPKSDATAEFVVYSFPLFTPEGVLSVEGMKYPFQMREGEIPSKESAIKDEFKPISDPKGVAHHFLSITCGLLALRDTKLEDILEERKQLLIAILPKGTEVSDAVERNCTVGIARDFRFTLKHPYFEPGTTVEIDHKRIIWQNDLGTIETGSMITGVGYIRLDGTQL